jgi:hypothetical protein
MCIKIIVCIAANTISLGVILLASVYVITLLEGIKNV